MSENAAASPVPPRSMGMVLPTFSDTFERPPRVWPPRRGLVGRAVNMVRGFFAGPDDISRELPAQSNSGASVPHLHAEHEQAMPRTYQLLGDTRFGHLRGYRQVKNIVVIGVHGWYAQSILKTVLGAPMYALAYLTISGTSARFAAMMAASIRQHYDEADVELDEDAITTIALQHDGRVEDRASHYLHEIQARSDWVEALRNADAVFVASHSQGAAVATFLLADLVEAGLITAKKTRMCLLTMCGIFQGPFVHLKSALTSSYINYFETAAAKELFEFQSSESVISGQLQSKYRAILAAGAKVVHVGAMDDNVVPLYSALYSAAAHPSILRAMYVDSSAYPRRDFLVMLLVLCVAVRNCGFHDHNLLSLLSASVAGSLYTGLGHSVLYDDPAVYGLATRYLFETYSPTTSGAADIPLVTMPFAPQRWNSYELPWSMRGLLEDKVIQHFFQYDIHAVVRDFTSWRPSGRQLKELQWRLSPLRTVKLPELPQRRVQLSVMNNSDDDADYDETAMPAVSYLHSGVAPSSAKL